MRIAFIVVVAFITFTACASDAPSSQIESLVTDHQSSSVIEILDESQFSLEPSISIPDEQKPVDSFPFVIPEVAHPYKNEMTQLISGFAFQFIFPEFKSVSTLDYYPLTVSGNIYVATEQRNDMLLAQGRGITDVDREEIERLIELYADEEYPPRGVRRSDMNMIGKKFFGEQFEFPKDLICPMISPFGEDSEYYISTSWRSEGLPYIYYLLVEASDKEDLTVATFLPFVIDPDPYHNMVFDIEFFNLNVIDEYGNPRRDKILFKEPVVWNHEIEPVVYLKNIELPFPQEQLDAITVTFQIQGDDSLIAISSIYNR